MTSHLVRVVASKVPLAREAQLAWKIGLPSDATVGAPWAAWANATAVRELDFHDTFLAADYAYPGDDIAPVLAVDRAMRGEGRAAPARSTRARTRSSPGCSAARTPLDRIG